MHLIWTAVVVVSLSIAASNAHRCLTGGIKSSTSSQMCPSCLPEGTANITVEKLTIGNEKNTIGTENFGDVCIKGSAQVPVGYMKPSDTLDVRAAVSIDIGIIKREFPCMLLRALLREQVMEADVENGGDYSYDYEDDTLELVKEIFDHFDNTCTLRDICGLFKTGSKLRKAADSMIELSDAEDLELLKGFNKTAENVCSADFLKGKKLSLNQCYKIESPKAVDLSKFRDLMKGQDWIKVELVLEIFKRDKISHAKEGTQEHLFCLFLPLTIQFPAANL